MRDGTAEPWREGRGVAREGGRRGSTGRWLTGETVTGPHGGTGTGCARGEPAGTGGHGQARDGRLWWVPERGATGEPQGGGVTWDTG